MKSALPLPPAINFVCIVGEKPLKSPCWKPRAGMRRADKSYRKNRLDLISSFGLRGFTDAWLEIASQSLMLPGSLRYVTRIPNAGCCQ